MEYVTRINLKTDCSDRNGLVDFCLNDSKQQYVAIGWSRVYTEDSSQEFSNYEEFYYAVKNYVKGNNKRLNSALNCFWYIKKGDLFWTRDLNGFYWICRAEGVAKPLCNKTYDIGAVVPVKAFMYGMDAPGQIKASFNRPNGGITHRIEDKIILNYSKYIFNSLANIEVYKDISKNDGDFINNLPDFELEELVISYLQIKENYYVLSNSIANKSTTIKIECILMSRDKKNPQKAVVQVKAKPKILQNDYIEFIKNGYNVYFYDGGIKPETKKISNGIIYITKEELKQFYYEYKSILPESITKWESLFV